jgi:hypothetical protein
MRDLIKWSAVLFQWGGALFFLGQAIKCFVSLISGTGDIFRFSRIPVFPANALSLTFAAAPLFAVILLHGDLAQKVKAESEYTISHAIPKIFLFVKKLHVFTA